MFNVVFKLENINFIISNLIKKFINVLANVGKQKKVKLSFCKNKLLKAYKMVYSLTTLYTINFTFVKYFNNNQS